jgi:cytochrome bd ubiquinol oxidase subunit II
MFDYETIRLIWWVFIGVVAIAFALTEGFDFGAGTLLPFVAKTDVERRVVINTVGGTWEGNQVWLVLLGGAIFAIWPSVYATLFSGLYIAMMLVLFSLFLRPAGFDYRSKIECPRWRNAWDWALFLGGTLPPILLGVLVGNLLIGLPFHLDEDLRPSYDGSFFGLLGPFQLLCGVIGVVLTSFHGGIFVKWRTNGVVRERSRKAVAILGPVLILLVAIAALWLIYGFDRPELTSIAGKGAPSNPMNKMVLAKGPGWLAHFLETPWMLAAPTVALLGFVLAWILGRGRGDASAFVASSLGIIGALLTIGFGLFPFLLISTVDSRSSLTLWDATSSHMVLNIAFWITIVFLPIVLLYTQWVYRKLWGTVSPETVLKDSHTLY